MTDLHTHILPGMDDGSSSPTESLALLQLEREQGVDVAVLTPHFYREREPVSRFLARRQAAYEALCRERTSDRDPELVLGAEVAWFPSLAGEEAVEALCLGNSRQILLELPFEPWSPGLLDRVFNFAGTTGLVPVFAHVERYLSIQDRARMDDLVALGFPMQMNADSLLSFRWRRRCLRLLERGRWYLGSDCHNLDSRPPKYGRAAKLLQERLGGRAEELLRWSPKKREEAVP